MKGCNLSKRRKTKDERKMEDRISVLPNEILVSIVSFLPLENAGATSILSRPWKDVWKYTSNLNFDSVRFLVGNENLPPRPLQSELLYSLSSRFVNCVNQVLNLHKGQSMQRFRVNFFLDCRFALFIDQWIHFAMEKGVQVLELDFRDQWFWDAELYTITKTLLGLGREIDPESLNPCTLSRGAGRFSAGFSSLKVLHLRRVGITGEVLESFLSKCPVLERLSLISVGKLNYIRAVGPLIALKHLVIKWCIELKRVEICDTKIVSFLYLGFLKIELNLSNVPLLTEVNMFKVESYFDFKSLTLAQFSCCLSRIEILRLDIVHEDCSGNDVIPLLPSLKHLELRLSPDYGFSIYHINSFLKASPYLQSLKLKWRHCWVSQHSSFGNIVYKEIKVSKCPPHRSLKVVEMIGYNSFTCWEKHVIYFIENLVSLEKIVIDPVHWCGVADGITQSTEELAEARDHIMRCVGEKVPPNIKLVCL